MGELKLASAGDDIKLWDCSSYSLVKQFNPHEQNISSLCWNHDNTLLSSVALNSEKIALTAVKNHAITINELECGQGKLCVDFNSTARYILTGGSDHTIYVWDLKTRKIKKIYKDHKGPVTCARFNWNDTHIASGSETGEIILFNVVTGQGCSPLIAPKIQAVKEVQFSRFKKALLGSVSDDGAVNLWDTNTRRLLHSFTDSHRAPATGLNFSPINDILLMSVGLDKRIVCYDVQGKKPVKTMMAESPLTSIDVMSNGAMIAVGSTRGKIYIYDLRQGNVPMKIINAHKSSVQCLKFQNEFNTNESFGKKTTGTTNVSPNRRQLPPAPGNDGKSGTQNKESAHFSPDLQIKQNNSGKRDSDDVFSPIREGVTDQSGSYRYESDNSSLNVPGNRQIENISGGVLSPLNEAENRQQYCDGGIGYSPMYGHMGQADSVFTPNYNGDNMNTNNFESSQGLSGRLKNDMVVTNGSLFNSNTGPAPVISHQQHHPSPYNYNNDMKQSDYMFHDGSPELPSNRSPRSQKYVKSDSQRQPVPQNLSPSSTGGGSGGISASPSVDFHSLNKLDDSPSATAGVSVVSPSGLKQVPDGAHSITVSSINNQNTVNRHEAGASETASFHTQFIRNIIREEMEDLRDQIHEEVQNLQLEMLRQFQIQQDEIRHLLQHYSVNEQLVSEVERLREENKRLKKNF